MSVHFDLRRIARALTGASAHQAGPRTRLGPKSALDNALRDPERIRIGSDCVVLGQLLIFGHGGRITLGDWCFVGENTRIWSGLEVRIGSRVLISHDVNIFDNDTHPFDAAERHRQFVSIKTVGQPSDIDLGDRPVIIGDDAWVGAKAVILKGVTIGEGAVVAAGAVVTRDVAPNTVVAGNPARALRDINKPGAEAAAAGREARALQSRS